MRYGGLRRTHTHTLANTCTHTISPRHNCRHTQSVFSMSQSLYEFAVKVDLYTITAGSYLPPPTHKHTDILLSVKIQLLTPKNGTFSPEVSIINTL